MKGNRCGKHFYKLGSRGQKKDYQQQITHILKKRDLYTQGLESFCKIFGEMEKTGSSENRCGMNKLAGTECSQLTAGRYVISGIIVECKNVGYKVRQDNEHPRDDCTGK